MDGVDKIVHLHTFFVLINGGPFSFFHNSRGLRHGYPLSLYLFVMGMEKAASSGFFSGYKTRGRSVNEVQVAHLLVANETPIFCEDSRD